MGLAVFMLFLMACGGAAAAVLCVLAGWKLRNRPQPLLRVLAVVLLLLGLAGAAFTLWTASLIWECLHFF